MKATICVDIESEDELRLIDDWFMTWREHLAFVSEDQGCGCCVNIWDVDGPPEAIAAIPLATRSHE